ncbi:MAG: hypothetical protein E6Q97_10875 [Desulfurellales bacterium]|nr:MAG: hypothetical protein E6Q97_10875 [Desulfurellales bacterium]
MTATLFATILRELLVNLPAYVQTASDLIRFIDTAYDTLSDAIGDRDVSPEEIKEIVARINAASAEIQSIP